jgi:hypothetical protein
MLEKMSNISTLETTTLAPSNTTTMGSLIRVVFPEGVWVKHDFNLAFGQIFAVAMFLATIYCGFLLCRAVFKAIFGCCLKRYYPERYSTMYSREGLNGQV